MTNFPEAIGWTLIHFCWQATVITAFYIGFSALLTRRSSQMLYISALCSLLLMLVVAMGTFAWELHLSPGPASLARSQTEFGAIVAAGLQHAQGAGVANASLSRGRFSLVDLLPWIDGIWLIGVVAFSMRGIGGWCYLRRLRTIGIVEPSALLRESFHHVCQALGLQRAIDLRLSAVLDRPITMGALRAVVLLPLSAVTALSPEELEMVFAHELAHVRRADFLWNVVQTIAETLFFFHPAVWWINARIRRERELCCDDLALKICPNPLTYAQALYRLEDQRSRRLHLAMALDGHGSHQTLLMRISRILGEPMTPIATHRPGRFSLTAACAGIFVVVLPVPYVMASLSSSAHHNLQSSTLHSIASVATRPQSAIQVNQPSPQPAEQKSADAHPHPSRSSASQSDDRESDTSQGHGDYIDRMRAAGYDVDLDKFVAMKVQGVTPEYARAMAMVGFGKPSADDLIACKTQGVSPEYIAQLKQQGLETKSLQDAIAYRIFSVTPDFVAGMKAAGFSNLSSKELLSLRVQGVTPEYARNIRKQFPTATADDLIKTRIFHIDEAFLADAHKHGFDNLSLEKLVQLRISGLLDDESVKP